MGGNWNDTEHPRRYTLSQNSFWCLVLDVDSSSTKQSFLSFLWSFPPCFPPWFGRLLIPTQQLPSGNGSLLCDMWCQPFVFSNCCSCCLTVWGSCYPPSSTYKNSILNSSPSYCMHGSSIHFSLFSLQTTGGCWWTVNSFLSHQKSLNKFWPPLHLVCWNTNTDMSVNRTLNSFTLSSLYFARFYFK